MKRRLRVLALSLSALAAFAAALILAGVFLLDWAKGQLAASGLGDLDFAVEGLSPGRLSLSDIRFGLGREQNVERLTLLFHPIRLVRDQSLDKVLVEGAELRFISGDDGVPQLAGVSLPETPGHKANLKMPALPVASLELRASRLNLETGMGALRIPLRGTLTQIDVGAWALDAHLELQYQKKRGQEAHEQEARGALAVKGRLEQDGAAKLEVALAGAEGWLPEGLDTHGAGQASVEWNGGEQFSGTGSLAVHLAGSPVMLAVQAGKTQGEAFAFALDLDASELDLAALDELAESGVGLAGRASLQARIEGALPVLSERWLEAASASGRIFLRIEDGALPGSAAKAVDEVALEVQAAKTQGKGLAFGLDLDASELDLAAPDELAESGVGLAGRASLQARIEGALPILSERWLEAASASGRISLRIQDGALPDLVAEASGALDLDLSLSEASLLAVPASPWEVTGRLVGLDPPAGFRLSDVAGHGLRLTASTDLARQTAAGAVGFALEVPSQPKIAGTVSGRVEQAPEDGFRFDLERLRLDPISWTHDGMEIRMGALDARLAGTASHMRGRVSTQLDVADVTYGGERLTGGEIELEGGLTHTDEGLVLAVKDCVSVRAKRLDLGGVRWLRPVDLCVRQARGRPLLRFDPTKQTWSLALTLPSHPAVLAVEHGQDDPLELAGTMPQARLSATFDPTTQALKLVLNTQGGHLKLAEQAVAVSDIRLALLQDRATSVTLQHAVATSLASPPDFPALVLAGKAKGRLDKTMAFELVARGRRVPFKLSAKGKHHFGLAIGELSYRLDKIRFSPQGLQPGDLVPALGKLISEARGSLAVSGGLSWIAGVPATHLRLALDDLGFDAPGLSVRGLNTRLRRAGRTVRNQLDTQEIRVDLLDIGIPLRNGLIRFHTREAPSVRIEQLDFTWGGGGVQIEPLALQFDQLAAEHSIVLKFEAIRLNPLLRLIPVDGLWGTGFLSGRVPLRIRGSEIAVDQGSISAETPGLLRYRPEEKPGFFDNSSETELLFEALRNFHYESLSIGLNGRTQDNLQLSISLAGANPDLYDGHPFKLNFNLTGELDTIIRRSLAIATFAERFGELMSRYFK
ncbi:intermembrane phospholipid transport protein YdbH family protein [Candidatus Thiosymbion oneisti]|uniref:intermembrane phospholipid transport protein YdbH family protein n=1 Tax=Candidatus Thiosymbion oneisti TaxID=589554 RepID=UPI00105D9D75|nr:YdbH domain-containing protein [Candidatus Thiosymbion oneisti]